MQYSTCGSLVRGVALVYIGAGLIQNNPVEEEQPCQRLFQHTVRPNISAPPALSVWSCCWPDPPRQRRAPNCCLRLLSAAQCKAVRAPKQVSGSSPKPLNCRPP